MRLNWVEMVQLQVGTMTIKVCPSVLPAAKLRGNPNDTEDAFFRL